MNIIRTGLVAAAVGAVGLLAFPQVAGATDASVSYTRACINPNQSLWQATITFVNQWDGDTTVRLIEADGGSNFDASQTLHGKGAMWTPTPFTVSVAQISVQASSNHPQAFHNNLPNQIKRPDGCTPAGIPVTTPAPPTTLPPTSGPPTTVCTDSPVSPVHQPAGQPCPTPATVKPCADGQPPSIPVEDGSLVCPEFGAPVNQPTTTAPPAPTVVRQTAPRAPVPAELPHTGTSATPLVVAGVGAAVAGVLAVLITRRRGLGRPS